MNKNTQLAATKKDVSAEILEKINTFQESGQLRIPKDYSLENALKSAYLILDETKNKAGQYALDHCTKESVETALLKMIVWGLSPLKKQCNFIMYGNKLDCGIEYNGNIVLAKRYGNLKSIKANAIFKDDTFTFEVDSSTGLKKIIKHEQTLKSIGSKDIKGAYAVIELNNGNFDLEVMNIDQIRTAWNQGKMKGNSLAHINFPDQMANKTVINRACKLLIRGSDDAILYDKEDTVIDVTQADVSHEITENANKKEIGFDDITEVSDVTEDVTQADVSHEITENTNKKEVGFDDVSEVSDVTEVSEKTTIEELTKEAPEVIANAKVVKKQSAGF